MPLALDPVGGPVPDLVAVAALVALLAVAVSHPPPWVEALVSVAAATAALATGLLGGAEAWTAVRDLAPVVAFLAAILVVSDQCDRAGLFAAAGALLRRAGTAGEQPGRRSAARRLFTVAFGLAAVVTAVLSLDATVVLLTPVVIAAARGAGVATGPASYACLRLANSASLLLPVSNLTNLLALPELSLSFAGFAATTAPVVLVVLLVEYVGLSLLFRRDLTARPAAPPPRAPDAGPSELPRVPALSVAAMLLGFAVTSPLGLEPAWVAAAAALALWAWSRRPGARRLASVRDVVRSAQPGFALLVLALGIVVAAVAAGFLGDVVAHLVPASTSFLALLGIAALATVLAAVLTNLSATLLLVPLVAPMGDVAVLAALVGLNVGAGLVLSGSLANLLWRRTMSGIGEPTSLAGFHRVSLLLTPVTLVAACGVLHLVG